MPIKSYIAYPQDGKYQELLAALSTISACDIIPSKNEEVAIIIIDTKDDNEDDIVQHKINAIKSLKMLSMVSGFEAN